jgi:hypothetical protein
MKRQTTEAQTSTKSRELIHVKILIEVGTAIIIVAVEKYNLVSTFNPTTNR